MTRRWTINGRFLTQGLTGVQRYAREVVRELDAAIGSGHALAQNLSLELLAPPTAELSALEWRHVTVRVAGSESGHMWEQLSLPRHAGGGIVSLCNTGPVSVRRQIVCIHDVNTRLVPESYSLPFRALYRVLHPALGRIVEQVTTVSEYSAAELERFNVVPGRKITVISDGHEHALRWQPRHSPATAAAAGPNTIVVIGSLAPHKNLPLLLGLAPRLEAAGLRLAIAGSANSSVFAAAGHAVPRSPSLIWLGKVTDDELAALLSDCLCLALPSKTEGFGLPPVEAMARGCPVVVAPSGSLPEICGDAALYAAHDDADAWLAQFVRLHSDAGLRASLAARAPANAARYSWRRSAEQYLELMARMDGVALPVGTRAPPAAVLSADPAHAVAKQPHDPEREHLIPP